MAKVSRLLGRPFLPWQHGASGLLNEHDRRGRRVHPFNVITTQRQIGKSSWLLAEGVERCLTRPHARVWYTAQSGQYAREKWLELAEQLTGRNSPLRTYIRATYTNGAERIRFPNGSTFRPFPPTRDALHSMQSDLVIVDEAWKFDPVRGAELLQAISPTQQNRPGAQTVIVSTQGTADSVWFHGLVDRGRAGDPAVTFLEHSIPDDVDPDDLEAVAAWHPAVGRLTDIEFLREQRDGPMRDQPGEFARAYGNRRTQVLELAIDARVWRDASTTDKVPPGPIALAGDIAQDRSRAAIAVCAGGVVEIVESKPGAQWIGPRMLELIAAHRIRSVAVDRLGPSGTLADDLARAGVEVLPLSASTYATACARFVDDLEHQAVRYRIHPALDAAAAAAAKRSVGDGWVWARRLATAPICELVAATLASWADLHRPPPSPRPMVRG